MHQKAAAGFLSRSSWVQQGSVHDVSSGRSRQCGQDCVSPHSRVQASPQGTCVQSSDTTLLIGGVLSEVKYAQMILQLAFTVSITVRHNMSNPFPTAIFNLCE